MKRVFFLGEKWLFYKIYCGKKSADSVLLDLIAPFTEKCIENKLITQWFFIRYSDPDSHLRLRFKLKKKSYLGKLARTFQKRIGPLYEEGIIWNICADTYVRELERYGSTIKSTERIFNNESNLVIDILRNVKDENLYFMTILRYINSFLNQFGLTKTEKIDFYTMNAFAFSAEFDIQKATKIDIDKKFRKLRYRLEEIMDEGEFKKQHFILDEIITRANRLNRPEIQLISLKREQNSLDVNFSNLIGSHIHMFFNRAFRDRQRYYEMLGYEFLKRHCLSSLKRKRNLTL